jgi:hypothetical protein
LDYIIAAMIIVAILIAITVVVVMLASAAILVLACIGLGWVAWRVLPFGRRLANPQSPVDRLTDMYVHGRMDIHEFEQRLAHILGGSARIP